MTRVEADAWAAGSAYRESLFHVTTAEAAVAIRQEGFDVGYRRFGRVFGEGVYGTPSTAVAAEYNAILRHHGATATTLELRANVRRVLSVDVPKQLRGTPLALILNRLPDGLAQYIEVVRRLGSPLLTADLRSSVLTRLLREAGYDALEIVEERITPGIGGTQVVIYEPRNVVVIDD